MAIPSILDFAHDIAARALEPGCLAIDATVGNGHDTLCLALEVGAGGRVIGFDVQTEAIERTKERLAEHEVSAEVQLLHAGHEVMAAHLPSNLQGEVTAVMFNLGYLPGGDHALTTQPETTLQALEAAIDLLRPGGVITVVQYTGHEGGAEEAKAVTAWASSLTQDSFQTLSYRFLNQSNDPPRLLVVEKRAEEY